MIEHIYAKSLNKLTHFDQYTIKLKAKARRNYLKVEYDSVYNIWEGTMVYSKYKRPASIAKLSKELIKMAVNH